MRGDRPRSPGDPYDPIGPVVDAAIVGPFIALAAAGELWDWARPLATAAGMRVLVWLREEARG